MNDCNIILLSVDFLRCSFDVNCCRLSVLLHPVQCLYYLRKLEKLHVAAATVALSGITRRVRGDHPG